MYVMPSVWVSVCMAWMYMCYLKIHFCYRIVDL